MAVQDLNNSKCEIVSVDASFVFKDSKGKDNIAIFVEDKEANKYLLWSTPEKLQRSFNLEPKQYNEYFLLSKAIASIEYKWEALERICSIISLTPPTPKKISKKEIEKLFGCEITP